MDGCNMLTNPSWENHSLFQPPKVHTKLSSRGVSVLARRKTCLDLDIMLGPWCKSEWLGGHHTAEGRRVVLGKGGNSQVS